jgi:hypothetical protein
MCLIPEDLQLLVVVVLGSSVRMLFCMMCLWFDQFVFVALLMVQIVLSLWCVSDAIL